VAIVVLNDEFLKKWLAKEENRSYENDRNKLREVVFNDMLREGKKRHLMSYEQIKAIEFIQEPFSIENGLLTPTFKNRRYAIEKKYNNRFVELYKTIDS
jgi:long-chain acyl-CoA synthetase